MAQRQRNQNKESANQEEAFEGADQLVKKGSFIIQGGVAALVAAALFPPTDAAGECFGMFAIAGWCLMLLGWAGITLIKRKPIVWCGATTFAVLALLICLAISTIVLIQNESGNARAAVNVLWTWVGLGIGFFLIRQTVRKPEEIRAFTVIMIGLAVVLSAAGLYQIAVTNPKTRAAYEADPEALLAEAGMVAPEGSAARKNFEDRLNSLEPIATFSLTNSLAGYLAPWLLALGGIALSWQSKTSSQPLEGKYQPSPKAMLVGMGIAAAIIVACLFLTKSRTAYIAAAAGALVLVFYGGLLKRKIGWKIPVAIVGIIAGIGLAAVFFGGLDREVMSEAPKSLLYRFEYWQSTGAMIVDHPILGVGPGNFQSNYSAYKLPQASETIADPHNALLEVWAIGGTLALVCFVAVFVLFVRQLSRGTSSADTESNEKNGDDDKEPLPACPPSIFAMYVGMATGIALGLASVWLLEFDVQLEMTLAGVVPAALFIWSAHAWVMTGRLPLAALIAAIVVLAVNLMAAGGIGALGVGQTLWVALALALNLRESSQQAADTEPTSGRTPSPVIGWVITGATVAILLAFIFTLYMPTLNSKKHYANALFGERKDRRNELELALEADSFSPEPKFGLVASYFESWDANQNEKTVKKFASAVDDALRSDPNAPGRREQIAGYYQHMFMKTGDREFLDAAIEHQTASTKLGPSRARAFAHLASLLAISKDEPETRKALLEAAQEALRLDDLNPHEEQKLDSETPNSRKQLQIIIEKLTNEAETKPAPKAE